MEIGRNTNKDKIKLAIDVIVPHIVLCLYNLLKFD